MEQLYLGVDLGGTNIAAGIVNKSGDIICKNSIKTNLPKIEKIVEDDIYNLCMVLCRENGYDITKDIKAVGVGTPGNVDNKSGIVGFNANFGYYDWRLKDKLEILFNLPVFIGNDADVAAIAEFVSGSTSGCKNSVVITLGTGIGTGVIINNELYSGSNFSGAEIGHAVIVFDGRQCNCGRKGCFERYASAAALASDTKKAMEEDEASLMWKICPDIRKVNARTSFDAMKLGDSTAKKVVDCYIKYLACGITNIINIFQPEVVSIGGGVSNEKDNLISPLKAIIDKEDYARNMNIRTKITTAKFRNDAGIIGAALLSAKNA